MARATPLQKPYGTSQTMRSGSRPPLQIHFEAGDPAAVVEWRGRPRFKDPMALFKTKDEQMDHYSLHDARATVSAPMHGPLPCCRRPDKRGTGSSSIHGGTSSIHGSCTDPLDPQGCVKSGGIPVGNPQGEPTGPRGFRI